MLGQVILLLNRKVLISKENNTALDTVSFPQCSVTSKSLIGRSFLERAELLTSAARRASSSFCVSVNWLSWMPDSSVPMYGVKWVIWDAAESSELFLGSAKKARSRGGSNSATDGSGAVYASTAGVIPVCWWALIVSKHISGIGTVMTRCPSNR